MSNEMKKIIFAAAIPVLLLLPFTGCKSTTEEGAAASMGLPGMIYDNFNNPVDGAMVLLVLEEEGPEPVSKEVPETRKLELFSDIDGRFLLPSLIPGNYEVTIKKDGFEPHVVSFTFSDPRQVLYVKLTSLRYLREELEAALAERDLDEGKKLINRGTEIDSQDPLLLYLKAVYLYLREEGEAAAAIITDLESKGMNNPGLKHLGEDITRMRESIGDAEYE